MAEKTATNVGIGVLKVMAPCTGITLYAPQQLMCGEMMASWGIGVRSLIDLNQSINQSINQARTSDEQLWAVSPRLQKQEKIGQADLVISAHIQFGV